MKFKYKTALAVMVLCASVAAAASSPAPVNSLAPTFAPLTNLTNMLIGESVALSQNGQTALVGMGGGASNPPTLVNVGTVLVYSYANGFVWDEVGQLIDPNGVSNSDFGAAVAVTADGKTFLVGAPGDDKAYLYTLSNGILSLSHTFSDTFSSTGYGTAVALSSDGTAVAVGDYQHANGGTANAGAVFVYRFAGGSWDVGTEVDEPAPIVSDSFGRSVAFSSDASLLLVGASQEVTDQVGAAYLYAASGNSWALAQTFLDPNIAVNEEFGRSVALSADGKTVLCGAPLEHSSSGRVYLFKDSGASWGAGQEFDNPDALSNESFGSSLSMSGDGTTWVASAPTTAKGGKAFLYRFTNGAWQVPQEYDDPAGKAGDAYGALALSGDAATFLVGAKGVPSGSYTNVGNAYQYSPGISLGVSADVFSSTVVPGGAITYDVHVMNTSAVSIASDLTLTISLPAHLSFVGSNPGGCNPNGSAVTCTFAGSNLIPGASDNINITARIDSTASGTLTTTFAASSSGQYSVSATPPTASVSAQVAGSSGGGAGGGKSGGGTFGLLSLLMLLGVGMVKRIRR